MSIVQTNCPNCGKDFEVPGEYAGKQIRCKGCQTAFTVPQKSGPAAGSAPAKPVAAKPVTAKPAAAKPVAAKPAAAKPVAAKPTPPADANAPIKFAADPPAAAPPGQRVARPYDEDEEDGDARPYGVTRDDFDVPRCPFCAKELDPPDTLICLNCGYDLLERRRHQSKKVYELTNGDYFRHWLPGIAWVLVCSAVIALVLVCWVHMYDWLADTGLAKDEKNPITGKVEFYLPPFAFNLFIGVFAAFFCFAGFRFAIKRLVYDWRPPETVKKT